MKHLALAFSTMLSGLAAQHDAVTPAEEQKHKAFVELAHAIQALESAIRQIDGLQESIGKALEQARIAEQEAEKANLPDARQIVGALEQQLSVLGQEASARRDALNELRGQLAREVPVELPDALRPLREGVEKAAKLISLVEAERALSKLESDLEAATSEKVPGASQLLSLVRYRLADTLRQQMVANSGARGSDRENEKLLKRSSAKFVEVTTGEDDATTDVGSSLRAAALRRIVQVEGALYIWNRELAKRHPSATSYPKNAKKHKQTADDAFKDLQRNHKDARLADGRLVVDVARVDISALER